MRDQPVEGEARKESADDGFRSCAVRGGRDGEDQRKHEDKLGDAVPEKAPLRRNVEGEDVGKTAVYLCSDLSSGVTGETIYVDCGINLIGA